MNYIMTIVALIVAMLAAAFLLVVGTVAGAVFWFNQVVPFFHKMRRK
jgi:hypothetical protein